MCNNVKSANASLLEAATANDFGVQVSTKAYKYSVWNVIASICYFPWQMKYNAPLSGVKIFQCTYRFFTFSLIMFSSAF